MAADGAAVQLVWKKLPKQQRKDIDLLEAYYSSLIRTGMHAQAEKEIAAELRREWRPPLIRLYGIVEADDPARQLKIAEGWLRDHGEDVDLLLAAARLCLRNELWGKARSYLETVIAIRPTPDAYQEFSPASAATFHTGRRSYVDPDARLKAFRAHPQTLAYMLTPAKLARLGAGASTPGHLVVIGEGEQIDLETVATRLHEALDGKPSSGDLRAYGEILLRLHAGVPEPDFEASDAEGKETESAAA